MTKYEIVDIMVNSFEKVNRMMSEQMGMDPETIKSNEEQYRTSILYILSEVYEDLVRHNILKG